MTTTGADGLQYSLQSSDTITIYATQTKNSNYYGDNDIPVFTIDKDASDITFTNEGIILGGGGSKQDAPGNGKPGQSALVNLGNNNTIVNKGSLLGGGGAGGSDFTYSEATAYYGYGSAGGAGGGGGGGSSGGGNSGLKSDVNLGTGPGGSIINTIINTDPNNQNNVTTITTTDGISAPYGGAGGGGPSGNGGGSDTYTGGSGKGFPGGNGGYVSNGNSCSNLTTDFRFGGGGGAANTFSSGVNYYGSGGGGYGGGNGGSDSDANSMGGGGGGGGAGGVGIDNNGGDGGYSINNEGTISTLSNGQGGTWTTNGISYGPLFYQGTLPETYKIIINASETKDAAQYGQLYCTGWAWSSTSGTLKFDIDIENSNLSFIEEKGSQTFSSVLVLPKEITVNKLGSNSNYSWTLASTSGTYNELPVNIYDLTITNNNITPSISNICFQANTPIITNKGIVPIEKLNPDIHTVDNKKIVAITRTVTQDKYLIKFDTHSLGRNHPCQPTIVSKNHKISYRGKMMEAYKFVGYFQNVTKIEYDGEVLYNILMEKYDRIRVNNLICETLHPENTIAKIYTNKESDDYKNKIVFIMNDSIRRNDKATYKKIISRL